MRASDMVIVGRGPAGLLMATLVAEGGGQATIVSDGQGSLPLWGGQFDFRNFDDRGHPLSDPYSWWNNHADHHPGGTVTAAQWRRWWQHLHRVWRTIGVPMREVPAKNSQLVSPAGRMRPTFMAPAWHFTQTTTGPLTFVSVPGLSDFQARSCAQHYLAVTGMAAEVLQLGVPPAWRPEWQTLQWAWFLDTPAGQEWLLGELSHLEAPACRPLVFPQILGVEHTENLMHNIAVRTERYVAEVPLLPPSIGGMRLQRRWERWLKRQRVQFITGRVSELSSGEGLVLASGRPVPGGQVVLATGGVLGGGIEVQPDGVLRDTATGRSLGSAENMQQLGRAGHPAFEGNLSVVGRATGGCDPDLHGDGGAMILLTVHQAYDAIVPQATHAGER